MNKTREQAEKIMTRAGLEGRIRCLLYLAESIGQCKEMRCGNKNHVQENEKAIDESIAEILDAVYSKPESERLKQLRLDRGTILTIYETCPPSGSSAWPRRIVELIDAEIEREKAKP